MCVDLIPMTSQHCVLMEQQIVSVCVCQPHCLLTASYQELLPMENLTGRRAEICWSKSEGKL